MKIEYSGRSSLTISEVGKDPVTYEVGNDFGAAIDKTFIKAVKKGDQSLLRTSYADACRSLAVPLAANEAMETGQVVKPAKFKD